MSKGKTYETIWREEYHIDLRYERRVYDYLCGQRKKRKDKTLEHKFTTYKAWKNYVKEKYKAVENLDEFYRFLRMKKRNNNGFREVYSLIAIPCATFAICQISTKMIEINSSSLNTKNLFNLLEDKPGIVNKLIIILALIFICVTPIIISLLLMGVLIFLPVKDCWKTSHEDYFYKDIMHILKELIEERDETKS